MTNREKALELLVGLLKKEILGVDQDVIEALIQREAATVLIYLQNEAGMVFKDDGWVKLAKDQSLTPLLRKPEPIPHLGGKDAVRCRAYAECWKELGKPEGWLGCSLPKGHSGAHKDEGEI